MPYNQNPELNTYTTIRFPLVGSPQQRDGTSYSKDQRFLNCFPELIKTELTEGKKYYVKKRAGLHLQFSTSLSTSMAPRGCIYCDLNDTIYFVFGNVLYHWSPSAGGFNFSAVLSTSTGDVGFTLHQTTSTNYVALVDGVSGWVVNTATNVATQITSANFPTPNVTSIVSMDGYLFVAKAGTADIYNSNVDDPLTWTAGDFITAEMYPDVIQGLAKNNNYVYAVGTDSVEYFYDGANATGSPLSRNDSAVVQFGTEAPGSIVQTEKEVLFVGNTGNGGRTVWMLDGFKQTEIGTEPVNQTLDAMGSAIKTVNAYCVRSMGHKFYVLRTTNRTWVWDFDEKLWHEWTTGASQTVFGGHYACGSAQGQAYFQADGSTSLYSFDPSYYNDDVPAISTPINMQITTVKIDFDTVNRKDCYRLSIYGDWPTSVADAEIIVDWSDDDYRTFVGSRSINLVQPIANTMRLGKFRRRAFRFTTTANLPIRLEGFEVDINKGTS